MIQFLYRMLATRNLSVKCLCHFSGNGGVLWTRKTLKLFVTRYDTSQCENYILKDTCRYGYCYMCRFALMWIISNMSVLNWCFPMINGWDAFMYQVTEKTFLKIWIRVTRKFWKVVYDNGKLLISNNGLSDMYTTMIASVSTGMYRRNTLQKDIENICMFILLLFLQN